jgi:hypothetical protein
MATIEKTVVPQQAPELAPIPAPIPNGDAAAAFVAAGIGCLAIGLLTTLAEVYAGFSSMLVINKGVGALSGKTIYAVVIWLVAWGILYYGLRGKQVAIQKAFTVTLVLIGIGMLGTFPTVFEAIKELLVGG